MYNLNLARIINQSILALRNYDSNLLIPLKKIIYTLIFSKLLWSLRTKTIKYYEEHLK